MGGGISLPSVLPPAFHLTWNTAAALQADLQWTVSNMFSTDSGIWSYSPDGNGNFKDLTAREKTLTQDTIQVKAAELSPVSWN
ncbi:MAG TPA: hypothetical protein PKI19_04515 [Elusimicrobiales bacterium]|nr:hypothetical protein [Elusimicrobiales bacterium]